MVDFFTVCSMWRGLHDVETRYISVGLNGKREKKEYGLASMYS